MDKDFLKKMLHEQIEPMDIAIKNKLQYLKSDEVFTDEPNAAYIGSFSDSDIDTMFSNAFSSAIKPDTQQSYDYPKGTGETSPNSASRHKLIAEKIAALRGINIDSDYLRKKKWGS